MTRRTAILFPVVLLSIYLGTCSRSGSKAVDECAWPRWRGPNGDGTSMEAAWDPTALSMGPKIAWNVNIGMGHSSVVIKDNRLYTMGNTGVKDVVYCLNAETGAAIWKYSFEEAHQDPQATPCIDGEFVYALSKKGIALCLKAKNGKVRWKKDLVAEYDVTVPYYLFAGSPVIERDLLLFTADNFGLALDKKTGRKVWGSDKPPKTLRLAYSTGPHYSTPVIYDYEGKRCAIISSYVGIHSVEADTGKVVWFFAWESFRGTQGADPLVYDSKVFISQYVINHGCILLDIGKEKPKILWKNLNMHSEIGSPVIVDGYIYGVDGGPDHGFFSLKCLDSRTGKEMWEENLKMKEQYRIPKTISITAADKKLIILDDDGNLHIAEATPSSYKEISTCTLPGAIQGKKGFKLYWTQPVLYRGRIYCRNGLGNLVCVDVRK